MKVGDRNDGAGQNQLGSTDEVSSAGREVCSIHV